MREELFRADDLDNPAKVARALHIIQRHVQEATRAPRSLPVLGGCYWPNVTFAAGQPQSFAHGLQAIVAVITARVRQSASGAAPVIVEVGQDGNRITLAASVACTADLWFYPQPGPGAGRGGLVPPFPQPTSGGATPPSTTVFTSNGTFTPTVTGTYLVTGVGGGAGGGGGGGGQATAKGMGGGGGGGAQQKTYPVDLTANVGQAVTIGGGGAHGAGATVGSTGNAGSPGGDTTFGALLTFPGAAPGIGGGHSSDAFANVPGGSSNRRYVTITLSAQPGTPFVLQAGYGGWSLISIATAIAGSWNEEGTFAGGGIASSPSGLSGGGGGAGAFGAGGTAGAGGASTGGGSNAGASPSANTGAGGGGGGGGGNGATTSGGDGADGASGILYVRGPM